MTDKYQVLLHLVKQFLDASEPHTQRSSIATGGEIQLPSIYIEFACPPQFKEEHYEALAWLGDYYGECDYGQSTYNAYADLQAWVAHEGN